MSKLKTRVIKANRLLQAKTGIVKIDKDTIAKCQDLIDDTDMDFQPFADEIIDTMQKLSTEAKTLSGHDEEDAVLLDKLCGEVMQIKGQAGMFGYDLASNLSDIMLSFLESIDHIDNHVIEILDAHTKTLDVVFKSGLKGDGGAQGKALKAELEDACSRYFSKYAKGASFAAKDEGDIFFVG